MVECYPYMEDLKELDQRSSCPSSHEIPRILTSISSLLRAEEWASGLHQHPDKEFSSYVMNGICKGFKFGFGYQECSCMYISTVQHEISSEESHSGRRVSGYGV